MTMIKFLILGAGGAIPTPTHTPAAYFVDLDGTRLLLDPGPGALVRLVKSGQAAGGVDDIDHVLLTHLHPDHCADLVPLLFATHSPLTSSTTPLRIYGPVGLEAYLKSLQEIYGSWLVPRKRSLEIHELQPDQSLDFPGPCRIVPFVVDHPQGRLTQFCLGYAFLDAQGHKVVFSGDTGPGGGLTDAAQACDLLVVECSVTDDWPTEGHLTPSQVGQLCAATRPTRVVLTHQYPETAALDLRPLVGDYWDGPVHQAVDGDCFMVPPCGSEGILDDTD